MLQLDITGAWLLNTRLCLSPNFNDRPVDTAIELLVIHGISLPPRQFGGGFIDDLFMNKLDISADPYFVPLATLRVSAHFLINRAGEVTQYVSLQKRAWHAGISQFAGRAGCNDFSVGIELEGCEGVLYSDAQYATLIMLTHVLQQAFPALQRLDNIVGHCDIAPERKTDPWDTFDWYRFKSALDPLQK
ncbi:1,6-anhydro-N-acetylmuramyl-L-alanine amidase AmpD [Beggiatoa leptomitoformis]|uniref:1,6-anhydro-N-acetylmuramyl-L-alanine amidase AmpD n=1 Tax=Beggiatoa leptomitoformis TaxID=288004 RepID=A0A2N9YIK1_9GAMM|nr:1,6-anhydro-N-acetylmuramyl-L-alanine amidase AmpD [Beggiatoa leptomitoformis]ALG67446.1 1,6-anhydro-N-acetylmuramyl-L-alanine amidase AmpD [Beggiatoa leptomitoformis]AUI70337.1 1,6-anhydro-N-acetylmuramyl-L-alanine amidase AmpD [Beggiatoa leptomitoformis]